MTTVAMAYRLITITGLYRLDNDPGHIASAQTLVSNFVVKSTEIMHRIVDAMDPNKRLTYRCAKASDYTSYCGIFRDGTALQGLENVPNNDLPGPVIRKRLQDDRPALQKELDDFAKNSAASIKLVVDAYDDMLKLIGKRYTPPNEAHVLLAGPTIVIPRVQMEGAFVRGTIY